MIVIILALFCLISSTDKIDIPPEPDPPGLTNPQWAGWDLLPNGLLVFYYNIEGKRDYKVYRRLKPSGYGYAATQEDIMKEIPNWQQSLFLYYFDHAENAYKWYAVERFPLLYEIDGITYLDYEEDGINGNEQIYERSHLELKSEDKI